MAIKRKLAVFDVDGTIFRASLTRRLFVHLVEEGVFPARAQKEVQPEFEAWLNRAGTHDAYIQKVVKVFMKYIKGKRQEDIRRVSHIVVREEKMRVYRYTRELIRQLRKKGYFLLAITGSPYETVRSYNRFLKFDKTYGWVLETDNRGRYTGKNKYLYSVTDKRYLVERAVKKYNLTLRGSIGVGDTLVDASFLNIVERPIAFNPSAALYKIAKKKKWDIVVERKDVIYEF